MGGGPLGEPRRLEEVFAATMFKVLVDSILEGPRQLWKVAHGAWSATLREKTYEVFRHFPFSFDVH